MVLQYGITIYYGTGNEYGAPKGAKALSGFLVFVVYTETSAYKDLFLLHLLILLILQGPCRMLLTLKASPDS